MKCSIHGCALIGDGTALVCPVCEARKYLDAMPTATGCICPPGANLQCQNPMCPRKPMDMRPTC